MNYVNWKKILELSSRWYVFFFLNFYGIGKIMGGQFYRKGQLPLEVANTTIGQASAYDLAWSFMGYSFSYILFIGISQIIGAWLLLWDKTKIIGVIILFPIMVNIIVFDIIFLDVKDALVNAILYFLMLVYILYYNKSKVLAALSELTSTSPFQIPKSTSKIVRVTTALVVMVLIFGIDQLLVTLVRGLS